MCIKKILMQLVNETNQDFGGGTYLRFEKIRGGQNGNLGEESCVQV